MQERREGQRKGQGGQKEKGDETDRGRGERVIKEVGREEERNEGKRKERRKSE